MEQDSKQAKPSFSIDSLLGKAVTSANQEIDYEDNDEDIDVEDDDEQEEEYHQGQIGTALPNLIRPIPRLL